jgi:hypothetical protein
MIFSLAKQMGNFNWVNVRLDHPVEPCVFEPKKWIRIGTLLIPDKLSFNNIVQENPSFEVVSVRGFCVHDGPAQDVRRCSPR